MEPIRLGVVSYLNARPLTEGLDKLEGLQVLPCPPSAVAGLLAEGRADLGLASIIDAVRSPVPLSIVPAGAIGCNGPTHTVRLYATAPLGEVSVLYADAESHTSVALARLLLRERSAVDPRVEPLDRWPAGDRGAAVDQREPHALLLIGDKVVTRPPPDRAYAHTLDLGEAWQAWTGLPFVFAAWMCRAADADAPGIHAAAALLDRQRRHNLTRLGWIAERRGPEHGWPADLARHYLADLMRYDLGPRQREAAEVFIDRLLAAGLVPPGAALRFADAMLTA